MLIPHMLFRGESSSGVVYCPAVFVSQQLPIVTHVVH